MLTKINVTNKHIQDGVRSECTLCPVALAIDELLNPIFQASIRSGYAIIRRREIGNYNDCTVLSYGDQQLKVAKFVKTFDVRGYVEPFSFELDIPDEFLAQGVDDA